jgi:O-methyltransferase
MDVAGLLLAAVLRRHKKMHGLLFDLPHVAAGAAATFARAGITGRVRIETGDFFKELPSGADAIIMKHIVHDWDERLGDADSSSMPPRAWATRQGAQPLVFPTLLH